MSVMEEGRGRQPVLSTGRGGAGNLIRSPSRGVDADAVPGQERGREPRDHSIDRVIHSGRGGAGNIRSPSRGPQEIVREAQEDALQAKLVAEERGRQVNGNYSTGRGGAGNISRSKSRSRSQARDDASTRSPSAGPRNHEVRSGGRGGWGNIREERDVDPIEEEKRLAAEQYEAKVRADHAAGQAGKPHATGKGGAGNVPAPGSLAHVDLSKLTLEERQAYEKVHGKDALNGNMGGRGGAGNFNPGHHEAGERGRDKPGVIGSVMRSLSRAAGRGESQDRAKHA